ncbi:MAG: hypothetical protein Q9202_005447 [Teloschistes flavicans]
MDRVKQDLKVDQQEDALGAFKEEVQRLEEKVRVWRRDGETFRQVCKDYFSWDPMDQVEDGDPGTQIIGYSYTLTRLCLPYKSPPVLRNHGAAEKKHT